MKRLLFIVALLSAAQMSQATDLSDGGGLMCYPNYRNAKGFGLARVSAAGRTHLYTNAGQTGHICATKSYVVPGNIVLTYGNAGKFTCALYASTTNSAEGGLPSTALQTVPLKQHPALSEWLGRWTLYGTQITIKQLDSQTIKIDGLQLGHELNTGYLDGRAVPHGIAVNFIGKAVKDFHPTLGGPYKFLNLGRYLVVIRDPKLDPETGFNDYSFGGAYARGGKELKDPS